MQPILQQKYKNKRRKMCIKHIYKHFPLSNTLYAIFNRNIKNQIQLHRRYNTNNLKNRKMTNHLHFRAKNETTCNFRAKNEIPLNGNCLQSNIIFKVTVNAVYKEEIIYLGVIERAWKQKFLT